MKENMNWYNRHLPDITNIFRTFIGQNCLINNQYLTIERQKMTIVEYTNWYLLGDFGDYLAIKTSKEKQVETAHTGLTYGSKEYKEVTKTWSRAQLFVYFLLIDFLDHNPL